MVCTNHLWCCADGDDLIRDVADLQNFEYNSSLLKIWVVIVGDCDPKKSQLNSGKMVRLSEKQRNVFGAD